jgi:hypothetical protein
LHLLQAGNAVREWNIDAAARALCMGVDMEHLNDDGETVLRLAVYSTRSGVKFYHIQCRPFIFINIYIYMVGCS